MKTIFSRLLVAIVVGTIVSSIVAVGICYLLQQEYNLLQVLITSFLGISGGMVSIYYWKKI